MHSIGDLTVVNGPRTDDANGNMTSLRGRNGQSTALGYDNLDRLTSRGYAIAADDVVFG